MSDPAEQPLIFPDIIPDRMKKTFVRDIEQDEIKSEADLEHLLTLLWEQSEVRTCLFWPRRAELNPLITAAERNNIIRPLAMEAHWYRHPNFKRDFIHIDDPAWDWEREVKEKQTMLFRAELQITEHEKHRRALAASRDEIHKIVHSAIAEQGRPKTPTERLTAHYNKHGFLYWWLAIFIGIAMTLVL
jgi:hypothetical protein